MSARSTTGAELERLKAGLKSMWQSGDYGRLAPYLERGAREFLDRLAIAPASRMLDVGCGTGQLAILAARHGIRATGLDLAANLVEQARARAAAEALHVQFDEGDAENLPYETASFDVVVSLLGAMFAPRPELVAAEMVRVCKRHGRIVMANWTPEGHVGQMFRVIGKYVPPLAMPSPLLWGDEPTCRQRLAACRDLSIRREMYPLACPFGPGQVVDLFIEVYGPTHQAHASLNAADRRGLHADLTALWTRNNRGTEGTTRVMAEYLEVVGITP
jgi:ubiquinone/menaquinone biosynthesis C-methylase UbiE